MQTLALFDLDNTLLIGDSDHTWGLFLSEIGAVDAKAQTIAQDRFYEQYKSGELNIHEFLSFQFTPLKDNSIEQLESWRSQYIESHIKPMVTQERLDLVKYHQGLGHETIIITATNSFITKPIADLFNIPYLIATEPEKNLHGFTGKVSGIACFQAGKIEKLNNFLSENFSKNTSISDYESWFYSDSHNDLPLLLEATHPVVVTPDEKLRLYANSQHWPIID